MKLNAIIFIIASSIFATLHIISLQLFLYWQFLWLDIPMHMLGGAVAALGLFGFYELGISFLRPLLKLVPVLVWVAIVAISWELFELYNGLVIEEGYALDTIIDLIMGMVGGVVGYFVASRIRTLDTR